jgi:hypothetical protein
MRYTGNREIKTGRVCRLITYHLLVFFSIGKESYHAMLGCCFVDSNTERSIKKERILYNLKRVKRANCYRSWSNFLKLYCNSIVVIAKNK